MSSLPICLIFELLITLLTPRLLQMADFIAHFELGYTTSCSNVRREVPHYYFDNKAQRCYQRSWEELPG